MSRVASDFLYQGSRIKTLGSALGLVAAPVGVKLLDISQNQSRDITKSFAELARQGYGGIIVRATDGLLTDKNYAYFWPAALDCGLTVQVYAALYANLKAADQANHLLETVAGLMTEVKGNLVGWADGETLDGVPTAAHRTMLLTWLSLTGRVLRKVGAYGSIKTWQVCYGNMALPAEYFFWNAQWRAGSTFTIPTGVKAEQVVFWQNGRWPFDPWIAQPDSLPKTEDVDCNVMPGMTMADLRMFTGQAEGPVVPPPAPVTLETRVEALETSTRQLGADVASLKADDASIKNEMGALERQIVALEDRLVGEPPFVWFTPVGGGAVIQHASKWYRTSGGVDKPIFAPVGEGTHPKVTEKVKVFPLPVTGDGGQVCYMLLGQTIEGETVYVRRQDGGIEA